MEVSERVSCSISSSGECSTGVVVWGECVMRVGSGVETLKRVELDECIVALMAEYKVKIHPGLSKDSLAKAGVVEQKDGSSLCANGEMTLFKY